jgi:hypothetical protein
MRWRINLSMGHSMGVGVGSIVEATTIGISRSA